ncbi:MAG TPA: hypothetical protein PK981_13170 [Accumulibacter sp.]|nr:hypothetical protein [Accumulibacter sp.]
MESPGTGVGDDAQLREYRRCGGAQRCQRQDHRLQTVHSRAEAFQPVDQHRQPQHQRQCATERETHAAGAEQVAIQAVALDQHRQQQRTAFPVLHRQGDVGLVDLPPAGLPEVDSQTGVEQRRNDVRQKVQ